MIKTWTASKVSGTAPGGRNITEDAPTTLSVGSSVPTRNAKNTTDQRGLLTFISKSSTMGGTRLIEKKSQNR
jgi:hypothetical protein